MLRRLLLTMLWLGFIIYAIWGAPPTQPDTLDLIRRLSTGAWDGINPIVIALFNAMGIWPIVYAGLALIDGQSQKIPAWPFIIGSFGLGAFVLLPYLILRSPDTHFSGPKRPLLKLMDSRWLGLMLLTGALILASYALLAGDWANFWQQWQTSRFVHITSLDFLLCWLLLPALLGDDMARRDMHQPWLYWSAVLIPLMGACLYLVGRPGVSTDGDGTKDKLDKVEKRKVEERPTVPPPKQ